MSNRICVDSCLAIKWAFIEDLNAEAAALFVLWQDAHFIMPSSFFLECASIAYHKLLAGDTSIDGAVLGLETMDELQVQEVPPRDLMLPTAQLAHSLRITAWDAVYLAVAEAHDCEFWTADAALYRRARRLPFVNLLLPGFPETASPR